MAESFRPVPRWDIVVESFREAEFLWSQWEASLDSKIHSLDDVEHWVERRLLGALDGVTLGGERAAYDLLLPALVGKRDRAATVAAYLLAAEGPARVGDLAKAIADVSPQRLRRLRRGIELAHNQPSQRAWLDQLHQLPPAAQAAVLDSYAFARWQAPPTINGVLDRTSPEVHRGCLRLAATTRAPWAKQYIEWGLRRSDPRLRTEAARAGLLTGVRGASEVARDLVGSRHEGPEQLLPELAIRLGSGALPLIVHRLRRGAAPRPVFEALAEIGTVEAGDLCASSLRDEVNSEDAAEALRTITGLGPDHDAPHLEECWQERRTGHSPSIRYLAGRPFAPQGLADLLGSANTRRRHVLATELSLRSGGTTSVTTTTWTATQRQQIRSAA